MGENEVKLASGSIKLMRDDWSGGYHFQQLGREDGTWAETSKGFSVQWVMEKDKSQRETKEERPDRLSYKTCGAWEAKGRKGFKWVVCNVESNLEDKLTEKMSPW